MLAEMGASVVRVERAERNPALDPEQDAPTLNDLAVKAALDGKKECVACAFIEAAATFRSVDVLLTSGDDVAARDEWLDGVEIDDGVSVHITPFGINGPYAGLPGTELNMLAYGAIAAYVGDSDREPIAPPILLASYQAGIMAAISVIAALRRRGLTKVDLAESDVLATSHIAGLYSLSALVGDVARRAGPRKPNPYPFTILPCKDGHVSIVFLSGRQWAKLLKVMGDPAWGRDPRFANRRVNGVKHVAELDKLLSEWLRQHTKAELRDIAVTNGIPIAPVQTIDNLLVDRQLLFRNYFATVPTVGTPVKVPRLPFQVEELPGTGRTAGSRRPPTEPNAGPLAGIRVLDLGRVFSGPMAGQTMADLGADVIKVESGKKLDSSREGVPLLDIDPARDEDNLLPNLMPHFHNVNRGKRSVVLNLSSPAGKEVLARLVADADIVIENFGAGSIERMGLPPEWFAKVRPGIILSRITICGQEGPDASLRGYAAQSTALGGLDALCAYRNEKPVGLITLNLGDVNAGLFAALATLAALRRSEITGHGASIDTSMMEAAVFHLGPLIAERQLLPEQRPMLGNDHVRFSPHGMYPTADEDEWVSVAVRDDAEWHRLCDLASLPNEMRCLNVEQRRAARDDIARCITIWTSSKTVGEAFEMLRAARVAAAPAYSVEALRVDPHARARKAIVDVNHHILGEFPIYGTPMHAIPSIAEVRGRAPNLGEHSAEVLAELGYRTHEIVRLATEDAFEGTDVGVVITREKPVDDKVAV